MKRVVALIFLAIMISGAAGAASIKIDAGKPGARFSTDMYGLFFEEINHAGDGGIYAELVQNRGFEDHQIPEGLTLGADGVAKSSEGFTMRPNTTNLLPSWSLVTGKGSGAISLETANPLNDKNPSSLKLQIDTPGAGIANEGYWGMNIKSGEKYDFSLYARAKDFDGKLTAQLETADGKIISKPVSIAGISTSWKQYKAIITATGSDPKAHLVISADAKGTVWFDIVSLFPQKTYKNRKNGFRPDLMKMMLDSKPTFLRWPGGCIVEGVSIGNIFRWKDTIGDIAQRPGKWNLWGYRRTDGFGYHEFLQLCEDTGMNPMFVFNAGMSCQWRASMTVPMNELQPYIDDALDAIEYAIGPPTSKWGAIRAANGHPKPFTMKYVEIGNENWGSIYDERYKPFFDAIKKKYPNLQTIATTRVGGATIEMADDHYYNSPEWFINNAGVYDKYDRKDAPVYIGEYCAQGTSAKGNLYGGLAEAAFLLGSERNADVVRMISYAPLLVNDNNRAFNPDSIVFDSSRVYGTGSYHVYSMLGNNLPDNVLPVSVDVPSKTKDFPGKIGVGSWSSKAEFKDIKVIKNGYGLFSSDTAKSDAWRARGGKWEVADGVIRRTDTRGGASYVIGDRTWANYTLRLKAKRTEGEDAIQIYFSSQSEADEMNWTISGWGGGQSGVQSGGGIIGEQVPLKIETDKWYDIKIELKGDNIKCYLDEKLIHNVQRNVKNSLHVAAGKQDNGDIIIKVCNPTKESYTVPLTLDGATKIAPRGTETLLTSNDPMDENSLDNPKKFSPITKAISGLGTKFEYTFKPYSFYILRLKTK